MQYLKTALIVDKIPSFSEFFKLGNDFGNY